MANQDQYIPHRLSQFEKATTGIVATLITALLAWVGVSVSGQQVQQAKIITTQASQSKTLIQIQSSIDKAVPARNALITSNAVLIQRVSALDKKTDDLEKTVDILMQSLAK